MIQFSESFKNAKPFHVACIYVIRNKIDARIYVGSATNFARRFWSHKHDLRENKHANSHLQNFYNRHGAESLHIEILKVVTNPTKESLIKFEQYFIDSLKPEFNICKVADSRMGVKNSESSRRKQSQAMKGWQATDEYRKKMSEAMSGKNNPMFGTKGWLSPNFGKKHKPETIEKMKKNHADFSGKNNPNFGRKQKPEATEKANRTKRANLIRKNGYISIMKNGFLVGKGASTEECAQVIGVCSSSVRKAIRQNRSCKGFDFLIERHTSFRPDKR